MQRIAIKIGQVWKNKRHNQQIIICGKTNDKFLTKILTDKPDVYAGTHKMARNTIWSKFELIR